MSADPHRLIDASAALEERIAAVRERLVHHRRDAQAAWHVVERQAGRKFGPGAWRWPLGLGLAGGCAGGLLVSGLLHRRGGACGVNPEAAHRSVSGSFFDPRGRGHGQGACAAGGTGPVLLLWPLLLQALQPAVQSAMPHLIDGLLDRLLDPQPHPQPHAQPHAQPHPRRTPRGAHEPPGHAGGPSPRAPSTSGPPGP